ncbi:MAG: mannose-6-phosphate isomerase, class I [Spirochaetia bacterium]
MQQIKPVALAPAVQRYDWGSPTEFPRLFGMPNPEDRPLAELWYGTHPDGPTQVCDSDGCPAGYNLRSYVQHYPAQSLGPEVVERFGVELPFLLKVIAAGRPLSLQAHPSKEQAEAGFAREEGLGIPIGAPNRSYRDRNHKPELLAALTPFGAMVGFREPNEIESLLAPLGSEATSLRRALVAGGIAGIYDAVQAMSAPQLRSIVNAATAVSASELGREGEDGLEGERGQRGRDSREADSREADSPRRLCYRTIAELSAARPDDPGILAPLYLNVLHLQPGQALYLPSGILHAYLYGVGVEIMANSNNVLRGGLTSKFIDREELQKIVRFEPYQALLLDGVAPLEFPPSFEEFALSRLELTAGPLTVARSQASPEILLCTQKTALFRELTNAHSDGDQLQSRGIQLPAGKAVFVPACCGEYQLFGPGTVFRACVGTGASVGTGTKVAPA